jgi:hypothetical protein
VTEGDDEPREDAGEIEPVRETELRLARHPHPAFSRGL